MFLGLLRSPAEVGMSPSARKPGLDELRQLTAGAASGSERPPEVFNGWCFEVRDLPCPVSISTGHNTYEVVLRQGHVSVSGGK